MDAKSLKTVSKVKGSGHNDNTTKPLKKSTGHGASPQANMGGLNSTMGKKAFNA